MDRHNVGNRFDTLSFGPSSTFMCALASEAERLSTPSISTLSFAYPDVGLEQRAGVAARVGDVETALSDVAAAGLEAFLLSTCLRVDVVVPGSVEQLQEVANRLFGSDHSLEGRRREGQDAITYLYRVAAGLESPVKGEGDVLVQFRRALDRSRAAGALRSPLVLKVLEGAVGSGRRARERMSGAGHQTLAHLAAAQVEGASSVAVFGAGQMGRAAVEALSGIPDPPVLTVVVRRPEQVLIKGVEVVGMDQASRLLAEVDAAVIATAARGRLLPEGLFSDVLARRTTRLTLVDMAVPPDLIPPAGADVAYSNIDQLAALADDGEDVAAAAELVASAAGDAAHRMVIPDTVGKMISSLLARGDQTADEVAARFAGRLGPDDREVVAQVAQTVARRILHDPISFLRRDASPEDAVGLVGEIFNVSR